MNILNSSFIELINECENELEGKFKELDKIREANQFKILSAMQNNHLSHADFHWSTGYGYGDYGREKTESIFAEIFKTEDALVRPAISSGTHALALALQANLLNGDQLVSISGTPYDTLLEVIGVAGSTEGTLIENGVKYEEIPLTNGLISYDKIPELVNKNTKMVMIQRSKGYSTRREFTVKEIAKAIEIVKEINEEIIVMVDNCYGEFVEYQEPSEYGADLLVGSLIKNPGGGIAVSGGYICGKKELIERCSIRLTAPGLGKETGLTFGTTRNNLQGLFLAPIVVNNAVKGACLIGRVFEKLGYKIIPSSEDNISDIVQAIVFEDPDKVIEFCKAVQEFGAVDSYVTPYPDEMPGYDDKVIMAAGGFIAGSSIEISADGPLREPYIAFYQGGLSYDQCKFALINILEKFKENNYI